MITRAGLASLSLLAAAACAPTIDVGDDAKLSCSSAAAGQCPDGLVCDVEAKLCVPRGATLDREQPFLVDARVDPAVVGVGQTADVTFTVSEALGVTPVVTYARGGADIAVDVTGGDGTADDPYVAALSPTADDASGPVTLTATLEDAAGNTTVARLPVDVSFDLSPPVVVAARVEIQANRDSNPIFPGAPRAVKADSGIVVDVNFDEPVGSVTLDVVAAGGDVLATLDRVSEPGAVAPGDAGPHARFEATVDAAVFAGAGEGALSFLLHGVDAHENRIDDVIDAEIEAALGDVVAVDNTPPAAPQFDVYRRAPWQSARGGPPTSGSGRAPDALLVLLVPDGATVVDGEVPLTVSRAFPSGDDGAFDFALPIDVAGLSVVAVDDAGNISAAARPAFSALTASVLDDTSPHHLSQRQVARDALLQSADRVVDGDLRRDGAVSVTAAPFWSPLTTTHFDNSAASVLVAWDPVNAAVIAVANGQTFLIRGPDVRRLDDVPVLPVHGGAAMATDERRGVVVLFGGHDVTERSSNQLFEWDGEQWRARVPAGAGGADALPAPRVGHAMAYVPSLGGVVIVNGCGQDFVGEGFGCTTAIPGGSDVWLWDGARFTQLCGDAANGAGCNAQGSPFPLQDHPAVGVDAGGRLVAAGGVSVPPLAFPSDSKLVAAFHVDDAASGAGHWEAECDFGCSALLPTSAAAVRLGALGAPGGTGLAFIGGCSPASGRGGTCVVSYDESGTQLLDVVDHGTLLLDPVFAQLPVTTTPDGTVVEVGSDAGGSNRIVVETDLAVTASGGTARRDVIAPSSLGARCGGAVFAVAGAVATAGGCSDCAIDRDVVGGVACNGVVLGGAFDVVDTGAPGRITRTVDAAAPGGPAFGAVVEDDAGQRFAVAVTRVDLGGATGIRASSFDGAQFATGDTLGDAAIPDLAAAGLVTDPADPTRALLFSAGGGSTLDRIDAVDAAGHITPVCASACGDTPLPGFAGGGGSTAGAPAVLFGGLANSFATSSTTETLGAAGGPALTDVAPPLPPARQIGSIAVDDTRAVAFLFGGTATPPDVFGGSSFSCGAGAPPECGDLWAFSAGAWTELHPVDVLGTGFPAPRVAPGLVVDGAGGLVVAGGGVAVPFGIFNYNGARDAWRLDASPSLTPAHLFAATLAAFGPDDAGTPTALRVLWCGSADDAAGAAADGATVSLWTPAGFAPLGAVDVAVPGAAGACVEASTAPGDDLGFVARGDERTVTVEVRPALSSSSGAPVQGAGFASLTTTAFEVVAQFGAAP